MNETLIEATYADVNEDQIELASKFIRDCADMSLNKDEEAPESFINTFMVAANLFLDVVYNMSDKSLEETLPGEPSSFEFHIESSTYGMVFYRKDTATMSVQ